MRLVFAGTPQTAVPPLDALLASDHEVVAVLTRPDAPAGRGRKVGRSPVARRAAEAGLEVLTPTRARDPEFLDRLSEAGSRLLVATLDGIEAGTIEAVPQPAEGVSFAPKVTPADARVDWK